MAINFDNVFPYNKIQEVTVDGQKMIKFPKTYVKSGYAPEESQYAGKRIWMISEFPQEGYHVHPAFMHKGKELEYFLLGAYEASQGSDSKPESLAGKAPWVNISYNDAVPACKRRNTGESGSEQYGWHMMNVYEWNFVSMLMLIELGTPDVQTAIGSGNSNSSAAVTTGSSNAVWRGLHEHWGNVWKITDGLKTDGNGNVMIWDNKGNETWVSTGMKGEDKGFAVKEGDNFSFMDLLIPGDDKSGATYAASTADFTRFGANYVLYTSGSWDRGAVCGAFLFDLYWTATYSYSSIGFRLAKYDI